MKTKNINPSWFMFSVLFLFICLSLEFHVSFAVDTISSNQSLSGNMTIDSAGGLFQLGFFRPGDSSNYYIGMWFKKVTELTTVWVANRDEPVRDIYSSVLKISDGNLVLFNESQVPIWSTNVSSGSTISSAVVAVLLDDGNLVLRNELNSSTILWKSFDHPTDTWLPGSKLGLNKRTNQSYRFISWKSHDDPAPGLFSIEIDPVQTNQIFLVWNRSQSYWTSGTWDEQTKSFGLVPEMRITPASNSTYNFRYVSNENESYFFNFFYDSSTTAKLFVDVSGQIKRMAWLEDGRPQNSIFPAQPRQQCLVYAFCGAFGSCNEKSLPLCNCLIGFRPTSQHNWNRQIYSEGCVRKTKLQCNNASVGIGRGDQFLEERYTTYPADPHDMMTDNEMECKSTCLENCSCTAYAFENNRCSIWIGDLLNLQQLLQDVGVGKTLYIKTVASELSSESSPTNKKRVIVVAIAVSVGLLVLGLMMLTIMKRRRKVITTEPTEGSLVAFGSKDLQRATKNFSDKLGKGGFGSVFKGSLPDGSIIAVKKLESINQGEKQFRAEVSTIGKINHVNLVRLRGFCSEGKRKLLVYDFMPKGSLEKYLFHAKDSETLDWKTRYQIALGAARGLAYLHENCVDSIIHCDIKPENILLDVDNCPKLADFGLAKLLGREFSRVLTTMRGTTGYLAPEWISGVAITPKADVYSFGMMLLELVSGRRNFEHTVDEEGTFFPVWVARQVIEGANLLKLLDSSLNGDANLVELSRTCKVACWCIQDHEMQRPSMGQVIQILEGVLDVSLPPIPRFLKEISNDEEHIFFFTDSTISDSQSKGTGHALAVGYSK